MDDAKTLAAQARISVSEIGYRFGSKQNTVGFIDRLAALAASHQAEVERLSLYKNLAEEYGLSVFSEHAQIIATLRAEVERLTDDRDSWRDQASARTDDAVRFAAERDALRKHAERYQWLRSRLPGSAFRIAGVIYSEGGSGVDTAIDAAMADAQGAQT